MDSMESQGPAVGFHGITQCRGIDSMESQGPAVWIPWNHEDPRWDSMETRGHAMWIPYDDSEQGSPSPAGDLPNEMSWSLDEDLDVPRGPATRANDGVFCQYRCEKPRCRQHAALRGGFEVGHSFTRIAPYMFCRDCGHWMWIPYDAAAAAAARLQLPT